MSSGLPALRFHWSLSAVGEKLRAAQARASQSALPQFGALARFCRQAEEAGIDSLLTAFGFHRPDPLILATALAAQTSRIRFMIAVRSGLMSPVAFVQQINTLSALAGGRVSLNVVAGHTPNEQRGYGDFLSHDERYARTSEFLTICRGLWRGESVDFDGRHYRVEGARLNLRVPPPEIFIGGNSEAAVALALEHGDCLWRVPESPSTLREKIAPLLDAGKEAGLLMSIMARPTREEAVRAARALIAAAGPSRRTHDDFASRSDSVAFTSAYRSAESEWLTPTLWTGAVPYLGAPSIALVGSFDDVAEAILDLQAIGISQFLFLGWPDEEELALFASDVLPRVRGVAVAM
ncbi:MAG: LLM class flavin-dependent oxidoreductase [Acidobacteriota bacterium]